MGKYCHSEENIKRSIHSGYGEAPAQLNRFLIYSQPINTCTCDTNVNKLPITKAAVQIKSGVYLHKPIEDKPHISGLLIMHQYDFLSDTLLRQFLLAPWPASPPCHNEIVQNL